MAREGLKRTASEDKDISPPPAKRKVAATTTSKAVANFFKPASAKEPENITFKVVNDSLLVARHQKVISVNKPKPSKIAAFDLDDTVIATASGNRFARDQNDWRWWHATVPARLKQLDAEGFAVVVMSNQAAVSLRADPKVPNGMRSLTNLKGKVTAVLNQLDLPITVYAATGHDLCRKPRTGMWEQMLKDYGLDGVEDVDHEQSVFVGDAAGRAADVAAKRKKDHSCSDRNFAANVSIPFHTPEEFFLGETARPFTRTFDPMQYIDVEVSVDTEVSPVLFTKKNNDKDIVLFCGSPGAGKSTFYWRHMQPLGYERVNQDILKTRDRCMKTAMEYLEDNKSVVVDNTNADIETRAAWIALARKAHIPIRLVHFTSPAEVCEHNNVVRALTGASMNPEERTMLPRMAFTGFAARYREPRVEEGFIGITKVDFKFNGTREQKRMWSRYWAS